MFSSANDGLRSTGDAARLISPIYTPPADEQCLEFWYHMSVNDGIASLYVYFQDILSDGTPGYSKRRFYEKGKTHHIVYQSVRRPSVSRPSSTISKIFFAETAWPIKVKFYVESPWVGGTKV